jgi:hypothetical protein
MSADTSTGVSARPEPTSKRTLFASSAFDGAAAHEALHADDGGVRMLRRAPQRLATDDGAAARVVRDGRREQLVAVAVGDHERLAVAHARHEGVRGAEIDADRPRRRLGVEDLQQAHGERRSSIAPTSSRRRRT